MVPHAKYYNPANPAPEPAMLELGMISHKMSLITIFGYKHFKLKFP